MKQGKKITLKVDLSKIEARTDASHSSTPFVIPTGMPLYPDPDPFITWCINKGLNLQDLTVAHFEEFQEGRRSHCSACAMQKAGVKSRRAFIHTCGK